MEWHPTCKNDIRIDMTDYQNSAKVPAIDTAAEHIRPVDNQGQHTAQWRVNDLVYQWLDSKCQLGHADTELSGTAEEDSTGFNP